VFARLAGQSVVVVSSLLWGECVGEVGSESCQLGGCEKVAPMVVSNKWHGKWFRVPEVGVSWFGGVVSVAGVGFGLCSSFSSD
jgi:hypothetical protein